jgi:putative flavoprotein involved in K+ transport
MIGLYDRTVDQLPCPKAKFFGKPHISGKDGGHTINLHQFARDGVILLGHLQGFTDGKLKFARDLKENLTKADAFERDFIKAIDEYVVRTGMTVPEEHLPILRDGFDLEEVAELDVQTAGITNVIWATSYTFDFSFVELPIVDADGYPMQQRGVTTYPGLYFVGLPWLHDAKSGLLYGVGQDAAYIAARIATDDRPSTILEVMDVPDRGWLSHDFCAA